MFALSVVSLLGTCALANELESETSAGAASQSEALTYSSKDVDPLSWNLGYTFTHLKDADAAGGSISDTTNQLAGGVEWEKEWLAGIGLSASTTPQEHLTSVGPNFELGYTWKLGAPSGKATPELRRKDAEAVDANTHELEESAAAADEPFRPSFGIKSSAAILNFKESFSGTTIARAGRAAKPTSGTAQILQTGWTWELDVNPLEWLASKATFTHYFYNRSVTNFLALLDSPRAVSLGASGFSNTVNGFQTNQGLLEFMIYPAELWELDLIGNLSKSASDGNTTQGIELTVARQWGEHWKTGVGYEYDNGDGTVQSLGVAQLTYLF